MGGYPFDINKATEVTAAFLEKEEGQINVMKMIKLVYLLDRKSFEKRGIPVVGGWYLSMKNGPVTSQMLDLINSGELDQEESHWKEFISDRENYNISLLKSPGRDNLSDSELQLIDNLYDNYGKMNQYEIRDWCHKHCTEWVPMEESRLSISLSSLLGALGFNKDEIRELNSNTHEHQIFASIL